MPTTFFINSWVADLTYREWVRVILIALFIGICYVSTIALGLFIIGANPRNV